MLEGMREQRERQESEREGRRRTLHQSISFLIFGKRARRGKGGGVWRAYRELVHIRSVSVWTVQGPC